MSRRALQAGVLAAAAIASGAASGDDLEDVLGGFEDEDPAFEVEVEDPEQREERWWHVSGSAELTGSINYRGHRSDTGTDYGGVQRLRSRLNLAFEADLPRDWDLLLEAWGFWDAAYVANGRSNYTEQVLDHYELDADVGEAWVHGSLVEDLDLKLGRQIVIWGRSETLRVLDVLNPLDNREPARVDLEDLRLPVTMLRLDGYVGDWTLTGLVIPEIRFDDNPVVGSDFFPGTIRFSTEEPSNFEDVEVGAALTGIFRGWDISFHGAWFWNDQPRFKRTIPPSVLTHDRLWMVGSGGNYAMGSWLFKYELAYLDGLGFYNADEKQRIDALLGVEYYGLVDTDIVFEVLNRHLLGYEGILQRVPDFVREDTQEFAIRITRNFLRDTLHATLVAVWLGWDARDGSIVRFDVDYDVLDALVVGLGIVLYQKGDLPPLDGWARNDRLIFRAKWSF